MRKASLECVYELAQRDERIFFVGSDLGVGTLDAMKQGLPARFFMEGVSEAYLIGMAAGLALEGKIPYVNTIGTFLTRRCLDQIAIDLCLHALPVRLIANGGGLVYAPLGPTHLAIEDMAIMRALPNMTVVAPSDADEMTRFMKQTLDWPHPIYIRLGKGGDPVISSDANGFRIGKAVTLRAGGDVALIATGVMSGRALAAADILAGEGVACSVLHVHTVKPLDAAAVVAASRGVGAVVTVEEHTRIGGLGSAVLDLLADDGGSALPRFRRLGLPDAFPKEYGSQDSMMETFGLQPPQIAEAVRTLLRE